MSIPLFKDIASEKVEDDEDNIYFLKAISVVISGEGGLPLMLNEIEAKGVR